MNTQTMKRVTLLSCKRSIITISLLLVYSSNSLACSGFQSGDAKLFNRVSKLNTVTTIIEGPINYQDSESNGFSVGYRPSNSRKMSGTFCQEVYDFNESSSALSVFQSLRSSTVLNSNKINFECQRTECGDVQGWRLFLNKYIAGNSDNQYFMLSSLSNDSQYLSATMAYVSEFDGQPRLVITAVHDRALNNVRGLKMGSPFSAKKITQTPAKKVGSVYFAVGQSTVTDTAKLESLIQKVRDTPETERFLLVGFTDTAGNSETNLALSERRAKQIVETLTQKANLNKERIFHIGGGETQVTGKSSSWARKVDVYQLSSDDISD